MSFRDELEAFVEEEFPDLSAEQQAFVDAVATGRDVIVDACIGSGKTTAIQRVCALLDPRKKGLYLTYSRLLKEDARDRIIGENVKVTNYHGLAFELLRNAGIYGTSTNDLIREFNRRHPPVPRCDLLVVDEYQDIREEFTPMLWRLREANPDMQVVFVGDMDQKIDQTSAMDVRQFTEDYLNDPIKLSFTLSFRMPKSLAGKLSRVWGKPIIGVNDECEVRFMDPGEVVDFLAGQCPSDVLCLGKRGGMAYETLNRLESEHGRLYNKHNTYAKVGNSSDGDNVRPDRTNAIFTTFDSAKGLERPICVIFDWTTKYWHTRLHHSETDRDVLRNIFCVAASRGKRTVVFVARNQKELVTEEQLISDQADLTTYYREWIPTMFDYKFDEDITAGMDLIDVKRVDPGNQRTIRARERDALIDLSPCLPIWAMASFFKDYDMEALIEDWFVANPDKRWKWDKGFPSKPLDEQVLYYTSLETSQNRYASQVETPLVSDADAEAIHARLATKFSPNERVQATVSITAVASDGRQFQASGPVPVIKNGIPYLPRFCHEVGRREFLQAACIAVAMKRPMAVVWNIRDGAEYEVRVPRPEAFVRWMVRTVTKRSIPADAVKVWSSWTKE